MYTRITEGISAIFGTELMCSGNCQKTVAAVVKFVTALGADAFEASLTKTTSSATIPLEDYQTEQRQMAEFMPRSGHSARRHTARPPARAARPHRRPPPPPCPPPPAGSSCTCASLSHHTPVAPLCTAACARSSLATSSPGPRRLVRASWAWWRRSSRRSPPCPRPHRSSAPPSSSSSRSLTLTLTLIPNP